MALLLACRLRDGEAAICLGTAQGLADDVVNSILADEQGRLWMSGFRGLFWVRREALDLYAAGALPGVLSIRLDERHGMPNAETNGQYQWAGARDSAGREAFIERSGKMMVPYLVDPNTGVEMFESADIIRYLEETYAKPR